ncbi:MAG: hypothetical protein IPM21_07355 [Acidobacteria bacterium]|nr:hypothetical protein [Acidobacteriota bacterium]
MAANVSVLSPRLAERKLHLATAIGFPLIVLIGYFKSYYFSFLFDVPAVANALVHAHGIIMSAWVLYFVMQTALIRTRNVKLHMTTGMIGVALAVLVIVVGLATAVDAQLVRSAAPPGANPHAFFFLPVSDMAIFAGLFATAIYFRKRPAEHKSMMFLTAIAFLPAALFRMPVVPPEYANIWAFGVPALMATAALIWHSVKHGKVNRVFAAGVAVIVAAVPLRPLIANPEPWLGFVAWIASYL